jgi:hypothetical protein
MNLIFSTKFYCILQINEELRFSVNICKFRGWYTVFIGISSFIIRNIALAVKTINSAN